MELDDRLFGYLLDFKNKNIIIRKQDMFARPIDKWSQPMFIKSVGKKRIHVIIIKEKKGIYVSSKTFIKSLMNDYKIIEDYQLAKYCLTDEEENLLDV